jgi:hypothetical protein
VHLAVRPEQRGGDGPRAGLPFAERHRDAVTGHLGEDLAQLLGSGDRVLGQRGEFVVQQRFPAVLGQRREDHLAGGAGVQREPAAQLHGHLDLARAFELVEVHAFVTDQPGQRGGLPGLLAQPPQDGRGGDPRVEPAQGACSEGDGRGAEPVTGDTGIGGQHFARDERLQDPVDDRLGQVELPADRADAQVPGAAGEEQQHVGHPRGGLGAGVVRRGGGLAPGSTVDGQAGGPRIPDRFADRNHFTRNRSTFLT